MAELEINSTQELNNELEKLMNDPSINKPSEEEISKAKEEFEKAKEEWPTITYDIGKPEEAQEICNYIKHFIRNRFAWQKEAWMGVIKLTEELDAAEVLFKGKKDKGLNLGYQALEFTYYLLTNPSGMGLQSAIDFESEQEQYAKITVEIGQQIEIARNKLKNIEFLQHKWGAMSQGFYLEQEDGILDESENIEDDKK